MRRAYRLPTGFALFTIVALGACSDDPAGVDPNRLAMERLAGPYIAEGSDGALTSTPADGAETTDWLAAGASLRITLAADGTTTGRLFVPGGDEDGSDFDADLDGTWTLDRDTVRFSHAADTFVRDMPFLVREDRLEGDRSFGDVRVRAVLVRQ